MRTLICYKTKSGATKKYMEWLSKEVDADLRTFKDVKRKDDFSNYNTVIVSSGTYAGFMPLNRFLKRHWKRLESKRIVVVAVGAALPDDSWSVKSYNRIPQKIREKIKYFKIIGDTPKSARKDDYISPVKKDNLKEIVKYIVRSN